MKSIEEYMSLPYKMEIESIRKKEFIDFINK